MDILAKLENISVKQKIEFIEVLTSIETNNRYAICNKDDVILMAVEDSSYCSRQCCRSDRPFVFNIVDMNETPQIRVTRHYTYNWCQCCSCCSCCQDSIDIEYPPGNLIGFVMQNGTCCEMNFSVYDSNYQLLLFLRGPSFCICTCLGSVHSFSILMPDQETKLGELKKKRGGVLKELLTDADNFEIIVPANMPLQQKVLLIGATLLIDFMFFEDNDAQSNGMRVR